MKKARDEGITLIALVISAIVMLILAAVTTNLIVNGGLFSNVQKAAEETNIKAIDEQAKALVTTAYTYKIANPMESFEDTMKYAIKQTIFEEKGITINDNGNAVIEDNEMRNRYIIASSNYEILVSDVNDGGESGIERRSST